MLTCITHLSILEALESRPIAAKSLTITTANTNLKHHQNKPHLLTNTAYSTSRIDHQSTSFIYLHQYLYHISYNQFIILH